MTPTTAQREDVKEGTRKALFAFWGVALTPGALGGIATKPAGGGVGKGEDSGVPPPFPVVSPEGSWFPVAGVRRTTATAPAPSGPP